MTSNLDFEKNEIGRLLLPEGVTIRQFTDWLDSTLENHFPTRTTTNRHFLKSLNKDFFEFDWKENETGIRLRIYFSIGFDPIQAVNPMTVTVVAKIDLSFYDGRLLFRLFCEKIKERQLVQRFFNNVHSNWPDSEIPNGELVLENKPQQNPKPMSDEQKTLSELNLEDYENEPETDSMIDWCMHKIYRKKYRRRQPTLEKLAEKTGYSVSQVKRDYYPLLEKYLPTDEPK